MASTDSGTRLAREELLTALDRAFREMSAQSVMVSQAAADWLGMASSDIECYDLLSLHGPMTAGRLAELTGLTTGAITGVVDRLERAGYARRERDPNDRRRVIVQPILERRADAAPVFGPFASAIESVLAGYTDEQLALILDFSTRVNAVAHEHIARLRAGPTAKGDAGDA